MQLTKSDKVFDSKKVEEILRTESRFITDLFSILSLPTREDESEDEEDDSSPPKAKFMKKNDTTRAKSLSELQDRLQAITSKKTLTYKEKMAKKNLKNRLKKKTKVKTHQKLVKVSEPEKKLAKPVFDNEGKMVFSKFDFSNLGTKKTNTSKDEKDPKKILQKLEQQKEELDELQDSGQVSRVVEIKEKTAWKNALAKAEGKKVKDDPALLRKSVQKQEQKKRTSKKKWEKRQENVEKGKKERQDKRTSNIEKRKKEKKVKKMKAAVKRGKVIPGF